MTKVYITKHSALQRQLDAAIRWLFAAEDPLPIHTIAAAACEIASDIAKDRGRRIWDDIIDSSIVDNFRKVYGRLPLHDEVRQLKASSRQEERHPANFLKHADRDPAGVLDADIVDRDSVLLKAIVIYSDIGFTLTREMSASVKWHCAVYPSEPEDELRTAAGPLHTLSRTNQIAFGAGMLKIYQDAPDSD